MFQRNVWSGKTGPLMISLYSLATGTSVRTWTVDTNGLPTGFGWYYGRYSNTALTWLDGGRTLAVTDGINTSAAERRRDHRPPPGFGTPVPGGIPTQRSRCQPSPPGACLWWPRSSSAR
jgi:hypothetical protein